MIVGGGERINSLAFVGQLRELLETSRSQVGDVVCSEATISRLSGSHCVDVDLHVVRELLRNNYRDLHDRERVNDHLLRTELIFSSRRKRGREVGTFVPVIRSIHRSSIFIFLAFIRSLGLWFARSLNLPRKYRAFDLVPSLIVNYIGEEEICYRRNRNIRCWQDL